jgi:hypothetical protein
VRDLALGLSRRGHRTSVYAPVLGAMAQELGKQGIVVVDDLRQLKDAPDIIHGHHNLPMIEALARFSCPGIWLCHDWTSWWDQPPRLARIHRYGAVDRTRLNYLTRTVGIRAEQVVMLPNAVDLARIPLRPQPLAKQPEHALAYTKTRSQLPILREACRRTGLRFAALGRGVDAETAEPERELVRHDIVFATGRSALEALCAGCAVIVGDGRGLVGMVTTANYETLREYNFGVQAFVRKMSVDAVVSEIERYNPQDALAVATRGQTEAALEGLLDALEQLYAEAIQSCATMGHDEDDRALQRFRRQWYPQVRLSIFRHGQRIRSGLRFAGLSRIGQERHK